ncbi:MAG TPA: GWxTD domain-containing protein [Candidatus Polarisedimenticolaceae bacterium]|nr:GWxTD domain-containing protein [Candidatus Polarisedimenticolaceae bacterium]
MRLLPAAGLALGVLVTHLVAAAGSNKDDVKHWLDGPVHYVITPQEIKDWKALKTDADRVAFVERFWRRRDPTPDTLSNEYRQLFWTRVREANDKFQDSSKPGWMTDRGKIYILYGAPDDVRDDPNAKVDSTKTDSAGLIRWVYNRPGGRPDLDPVVYVPFVRDVTGEYHVSSDPSLASPFFDLHEAQDRKDVGMVAPTSRSPLGVLLDLGKMQEVPPQEKYILDSVEAVETFAYQPLPLAVDRFRQEKGGMLAVATVAIPGEADSAPPSLIARFAKPGNGGTAHLLGEGSFRVEGEGVARTAQGRVQLEPGAWEVTVLAVDPSTGVSRIYRGRIDPLPSGTGVSVSDTVLARTMEPLPYVAQSSYDSPYIIGGFHVVPRAAETLARGDPVRVFFEIYGSAPPYHVTYQLEGKETDGSWRALGRPQEREATTIGQGFELPTAASWPLGAYRLRIRVVDATAAAVETTAPFSVVEHENAAPADAPQPVVPKP